MDTIERLVTQVIAGLVANNVLIWTRESGLVVAASFGTLAGLAVETLLQLVLNGGRRIMTAIRNRRPEDSIVGVVFREIVAIGSDSLDVINECIMAIVLFLKKLLNKPGQAFESFVERGANFTRNLGQRSLGFTSVSSVQRN